MPAQPMNTGNSLESNFQQFNSLLQDFNNTQTTEIFKDGTGTRRVLLGSGLNDFYGLKVSKPGQDVYSAPDSQLVFNSDQNVFKIVAKVSDSVTANNTGSGVVGIKTVTHNLGYIPAVLGYLNFGTVWNSIPAATGATVGASSITFNEYVEIKNITTTDLQVWFSKSSAGSATYPFTIYLLQETAS